MLLDKGASLFAKTKIGDHTPLHEAAKHGSTDVIRVLIERGADINVLAENGDTPLHLAVTWEKTSAVKVLLELGADIQKKDQSGYTP